MLKFAAPTFAAAIMSLSLAQTVMTVAKQGDQFNWDPKQPVPKDGLIGNRLRALRTSLEELGARYTLKLVDRVVGDLDKGTYPTEQCYADLRAINERLFHELEEIHVFTVTADDAKYVNHPVAPFGDEVANRFPTSSYDVAEATKCLGLRRSTACVMHTMRALETPLALMAAPFNVDATHTNWHNILDQIEAGIRGMNGGQGADWKERQKFFAGAASHFRMIKDGWRNHAMHLRQKYTDPEAREIYDSTRAFMRHLSQQLSEKPAGSS